MKHYPKNGSVFLFEKNFFEKIFSTYSDVFFDIKLHLVEF